MTAPLSVTVVGMPAPQGSKRAVGRGVMIESSKQVRPWRNAVAVSVARKMHADRLLGWKVGPVVVSVTFYLPRPVSLPKRIERPDRRPDLDKLLRSTLDGLTESGVIRDDAQVVVLHARKCYALPGRPLGARVTIGPA